MALAKLMLYLSRSALDNNTNRGGNHVYITPIFIGYVSLSSLFNI